MIHDTIKAVPNRSFSLELEGIYTQRISNNCKQNIDSYVGCRTARRTERIASKHWFTHFKLFTVFVGDTSIIGLSGVRPKTHDRLSNCRYIPFINRTSILTDECSFKRSRFQIAAWPNTNQKRDIDVRDITATTYLRVN